MAQQKQDFQRQPRRKYCQFCKEETEYIDYKDVADRKPLVGVSDPPKEFRMKVILLSELRGKGGEGDVVDVAQGFAENYLFPNKIAQPATPGNIKQLEERRHNIEKREAQRIANAEALKAALDGKSVTVDAKIGEEGQLFGSVTPAQIADAVQAQLGLEVDRKRVGRGNNIKTSGKHAVEINLYREITATVNVLVGVTEEAAVEETVAEEVVEAEAEAAAEVATEEAAE